MCSTWPPASPTACRCCRRSCSARVAPDAGRRVRGFRGRVDAGERRPLLDPYGAEALEEFFAVASEAFFVNPLALQAEHAALYAMFVRFYRQDPAGECAAARR